MFTGKFVAFVFLGFRVEGAGGSSGSRACLAPKFFRALGASLPLRFERFGVGVGGKLASCRPEPFLCVPYPKSGFLLRN